MGEDYKKKYRKNLGALEWIDSIVLSVALLALLFTFGVRVIRVSGHSMEPTLQDQELILVSSAPYAAAYGDIVVVDQYTPHGSPLVKRVIGMAGDTIDIDFAAGVVYRNGEALEEPYTAAPTYLQEGVVFPVTVPEGAVFIMGDNRNDSWDSRATEIGFIDVRDVMGQGLYHVLPPRAIGAA